MMSRIDEGPCQIAEKTSLRPQSSLRRISEPPSAHDGDIDTPQMCELSCCLGASSQETSSISDATSVHFFPFSDGSPSTARKRLEEHHALHCVPATNISTVHKKAAVPGDSGLCSSAPAGSSGEMSLVQKSSKPVSPASSTKTSTSPPPDGSSCTVTNRGIIGEITTRKIPASHYRASAQDLQSVLQFAEVPRLQSALKERASQRVDESSNSPLSTFNRPYSAENSGPSVSKRQYLHTGDGLLQNDETCFSGPSFPAMSQILAVRSQLGCNMVHQLDDNHSFVPTSDTIFDDLPAQLSKSASCEKFENDSVSYRYNSLASVNASGKTTVLGSQTIHEAPLAKHVKNKERERSCMRTSRDSQRVKVRRTNFEASERELRRTLCRSFYGDSNDIAEPSTRKSRFLATRSRDKLARNSIHSRGIWKHFDCERPPDSAPRFASEECNADFIVRPHKHQVLFKEWLLYPLSVFLLFGVGLVCVFMLLPAEGPAHINARALTSDICRSTSCLEIARYLNDLLSWKVDDPCDDFYSFVCRRWKSHYITVASKDHPISYDDDYSAYLESKMHAIIQDEPLKSDVLLPVRQLYMRCRDRRASEVQGFTALQELMSELSLEGFPFAAPMESSVSIWESAAKALRKTGTSALLSVGVAASQSQPYDRDFTSVGPPEFVTDSEDIDMNEAIDFYTEAVFSSSRVFKKQILLESSHNIVKFAVDLEKIGDAKLWRKNSPNIIVLKSPSQLLEFLTELFRGINGSLFAGEGSEVMVLSPILVNKIFDLVRGTEVHTVMNYLAVRVVIGTSVFLPQAGLDDFYSTLIYARRRRDVPRWQLCLRAVEKALFPLVHASLMANLELHTHITSFLGQTHDFMEAFLDVIEASPQFDVESETAIRSLISAAEVHIFGPEWVINETLIQQYVQGLPLVANNQSFLELYTKNYEYTFLASHVLSSSSRWTRSAFSTDCWHELYPATLYIPLLVFNVVRAPYNELGGVYHFARTGPRLSRCIFDLMVHATFATRSSAANFLTESTVKEMRSVEACIYSPGGELYPRFARFRDILAVRTAYAYFRNESRHETKNLRLSDDHVLTGQQLFFIYLMLQTCKYGTSVGEDITGGRDWEVALGNSDDFADAFHCERGSRMKPLKKCVL